MSMLGLFFVSALSACGGGDDGGPCTTEAITSVALTIVDQFNTPLSDVTVTYQRNGGAAQIKTCDSTSNSLTSCSIWNEVGVFVITASKPGYKAASGTVTVMTTEGPCPKPITQRLTLTLQPAS